MRVTRALHAAGKFVMVFTGFLGMARARNLKPSFFRNEKLVARSFASRLLYAGLWTLADRRGILKDRPAWIEMEVFPADTVDVEALLNELADWREDEDEPLIYRYEVDGKRCIFIPGFAQHNRPHKDEKKSDLPDAPPLVRPPRAEPCAQVVANTTDYIEAGKKPGQPEEKPANCADSLLLNEDSPIPPSASGEGGEDEEIAVQVRHYFHNHPILIYDRKSASNLERLVRAKGWPFAERWVQDGVEKSKKFPVSHALGVWQREEHAASGAGPPREETPEQFAARMVAKGNRGEACTKTTN